MEFHRPKAFANFGEFLREYAIIVTGVLTALALEAGLMALHDRQAAGEARVAVRDEISRNLGQLDSRTPFEPCVIRRFAEIEGLIEHPPAANAPIWIGHPLNYPTRDAAYRTAQSAGRLALLPVDEQHTYAIIYADFASFNDALQREQLALADLRTLELHPPMTPDVVWRLRSALAQARFAHWQQEISVGTARLTVSQLGIADGPAQKFKAQSICIPIATPRDEALRQIAAGRGNHLIYDEP